MKTINIVSVHANPWLRQLPKGKPELDGWKFIFNAVEEDYDYLVVFDELSAPMSIRCDKKNLIHISTEPPIYRHYKDKYLDQFAWTIRQGLKKKIKGAIYNQPGLNWHIGWKPNEVDLDKILDFSQIKSLFDAPKTKLISVISSNLSSAPQHRKRLKFALKLKEYYGDKIDFFGRGIVTMDDKLEALKDYRFNVVLENYSLEHYFSEKLTDCILSGTYPIYYGCPNLDEYFSQNAYCQIDIHNFKKAVKIIDHAVKEEFDKKFRSELLKARQLTLYKYNIFPMLINVIKGIEKGEYGPPNENQLTNNYVIIPLESYGGSFPKIKIFLRYWLSRITDKFRY